MLANELGRSVKIKSDQLWLKFCMISQFSYASNVIFLQLKIALQHQAKKIRPIQYITSINQKHSNQHQHSKVYKYIERPRRIHRSDHVHHHTECSQSPRSSHMALWFPFPNAVFSDQRQHSSDLRQKVRQGFMYQLYYLVGIILVA